MKIATFLINLCLLTTIAPGGPKQAQDFPFIAHIVASRNPVGSNVQELNAVIDGKQVSLFGNAMGVLALGDYKARISSGSYTQVNPNAYDLRITYEFLFSDGHTRTYRLVGLGFGDLNPDHLAL